MLRQHPFSSPSRVAAAKHHYAVQSRKIAFTFAHQVAAAQSASTSVREEGGKPAVPVQVSRPSLPCDKPLPLANVVEVQRFLFLLEAPEYCMRAFREHGVNGQDLVHMQEDDLNDSRFKFPRHVQRKVLRITAAWHSFQLLNGGPTQTSLPLERFLDHHLKCGRSPSVMAQLQLAFLSLDVNNNGCLTFEEFLVGFSLLEAAAAAPAPAARCDSLPPQLCCSSSSPSDAGVSSASIDMDMGVASNSTASATVASLPASPSATRTAVATSACTADAIIIPDSPTPPLHSTAAAAVTPDSTVPGPEVDDARCSTGGGNLIGSLTTWLRL